MENLCRVCLKQSKTMISLSKQINKKLENRVSFIRQVLSRVTNTKILKKKEYPGYMCSKCVRILNISYKFLLQFEESQKLLHNYIDNCSEKENLKSETETRRELEKKEAIVELISTQGTYDLKDVFVVEVEEDERPNFTGFLQNLGNEISASFVNVSRKSRKLCELDDYSLSTVKLNNYDIYKNTIVSNDRILEKKNDDTDTNEKSDCKLIKCEQCPKLFSNKIYLKRHVQYVHLRKTKICICEICGIFLKSRSSLYHHMLTHNGKCHECNICHKAYFSKSHLQQHIKAVHKNERLHLCTLCGKTFNYSNALEYHMRLHSGERKYKCSHCDKKFTMLCSLNRHLRIHTGSRPYKCKYCEKAFKSKGEVDCHEMTHTGYRPYYCKYCNKGFTKSYNLKVHLQAHIGEYDCKICTKSFIELSILKVHMKSRHFIPEVSEGVFDGNEETI